MKNSKAKGFSLLELIVVIFIIGTIGLLTTVNLESYRKASLVDNAAREIVTMLQSARSKTLAGEGGLAYRVHFTASTVEIFDEKDKQISRISVDDALQIIVPSSDINFKKVSGNSNSGTVTVRVKNSTTQKIISVSQFGTITMQ